MPKAPLFRAPPPPNSGPPHPLWPSPSIVLLATGSIWGACPITVYNIDRSASNARNKHRITRLYFSDCLQLFDRDEHGEVQFRLCERLCDGVLSTPRGYQHVAIVFGRLRAMAGGNWELDLESDQDIKRAAEYLQQFQKLIPKVSDRALPQFSTPTGEERRLPLVEVDQNFNILNTQNMAEVTGRMATLTIPSAPSATPSASSSSSACGTAVQLIVHSMEHTKPNLVKPVFNLTIMSSFEDLLSAIRGAWSIKGSIGGADICVLEHLGSAAPLYQHVRIG
ncbi:hypothetical protein BGX38DRAFT_1277830 [Terfezia claveryi]|nr:hypothetical protein BGX38DRAFT_1277830 [Terfezia claveryi]